VSGEFRGGNLNTGSAEVVHHTLKALFAVCGLILAMEQAESAVVEVLLSFQIFPAASIATRVSKIIIDRSSISNHLMALRALGFKIEPKKLLCFSELNFNLRDLFTHRR
jgi:hypothetical protein